MGSSGMRMTVPGSPDKWAAVVCVWQQQAPGSPEEWAAVVCVWQHHAHLRNGQQWYAYDSTRLTWGMGSSGMRITAPGSPEEWAAVVCVWQHQAQYGREGTGPRELPQVPIVVHLQVQDVLKAFRGKFREHVIPEVPEDTRKKIKQ